MTNPASRATSETATDAESIGELIDDCAEIPRAVCTSQTLLPLPMAAAPWTVNDTCVQQVEDLDDYV
ncbi:MAG TPA: hypothetical protein VF444_02355 [Pseudonocardiaceae bacterium]